MKHDTAGDPMTDLKWTRKTTEKIACQLAKLGITVDAKTVGRILKELGYSLRVNSKKISSSRNPDRNAQFEYIEELREQFASCGDPVASVDTKKKELVHRKVATVLRTVSLQRRPQDADPRRLRRQ